LMLICYHLSDVLPDLIIRQNYCLDIFPREKLFQFQLELFWEKKSLLQQIKGQFDRCEGLRRIILFQTTPYSTWPLPIYRPYTSLSIPLFSTSSTPNISRSTTHTSNNFLPPNQGLGTPRFGKRLNSILSPRQPRKPLTLRAFVISISSIASCEYLLQKESVLWMDGLFCFGFMAVRSLAPEICSNLRRIDFVRWLDAGKFG